MGKNNNVIINYLSDKRRFADMINAELYGGRQVIKPDKLKEISGNSYTLSNEKEAVSEWKRKERRQDLAMSYEDGGIYRIFLTEEQDKVLYTLPLRDMDYKTASYRKQYEQIKREHDRNADYDSMAERFSGFNKTDRLTPAYLLWVYHGEEEWDGPRTLKDMMDFGDDRDGFSKVFRDFEPQLLCINEMKDTEKYQTELKALFELLRLRSDKKALKSLVNKDERYNRLDEETYETAAVLMNAPALLKKKQKYSDNDGRKYDMCKALRDWEEEIREEVSKAIRDESVEELKKKDEELEKKDAKIDAQEKEIIMLRAKLEAAGLA